MRYQFRDTLSHIDVSPAGHEIKLNISHMKSFIGLTPFKHQDCDQVHFTTRNENI